MESLFNYGSDDENEGTNTEAKAKSPEIPEQDVNYDHITMEMSEDSTSNHGRHFTSSSMSEESQASVSSPPRTSNNLPLSGDELPSKPKREEKEPTRSRSKSNDRHRSREKSFEKRKKYGRDDRDREKERGRDREDRYRHRRSRSPSYRYDRPRRSRSPRSPRDRSKRRDSPGRRHRERDRSPRRGTFDRKPSKLSILEKLGIELKLPDGVDKDGTGLPSYYNPVAMNPAKYAEQMAKRKLLWSNSNKQAKTSGDGTTDGCSKNLWQGATFSHDSDGKMTAKFQRLMGIKQPNQAGEASSSSETKTGKDLIKKQEELFSSMELQYEVARAATHTQRGVGLGFGVHHYPR